MAKGSEEAVRPGRALAAAVAGGLIAGTVDIVNAVLIYRAGPALVLQSIAKGVLGKAAFKGGLGAAALGAGLHAFISIVAALIYVTAGLRAPVLLRRPILIGIPFGAGVFVVMNYVVLPLSQAAGGHKPLLQGSLDFAANCLFGVIIAVTASRVLRAKA